MTETREHTPGPWRIGGDLITSEASPCVEIATVYSRHTARRDAPLTPEADANRALIAAAPGLYAALLDLLDADAWSQVERMSEDDIQREIRARAAIAKAEGGAS